MFWDWQSKFNLSQWHCCHCTEDCVSIFIIKAVFQRVYNSAVKYTPGWTWVLFLFCDWFSLLPKKMPCTGGWMRWLHISCITLILPYVPAIWGILFLLVSLLAFHCLCEGTELVRRAWLDPGHRGSVSHGAVWGTVVEGNLGEGVGLWSKLFVEAKCRLACLCQVIQGKCSQYFI